MSNCEHNCKCINKQKEIGELMNYIGDKLKNLRQQLGLTQTEMAAGVISVSFYSKVERGLNDIGVNDFLEILKKHNVSFQGFLDDYEVEENNKKYIKSLMYQFVKAATEDKDEEIKKIITQLENIEPRTPFIKFSLLQAKLIANTHDKNALQKLTNKQKREMKRIIFQKDTDENQYHRIVIIANIIRIYSFEEATFLIKSIIRRYKNIDKLEKKMIVALSVLMVNYVNWCVEKKEYKSCYEPLSYLNDLPTIIEIAFTKILGQYFEDIINNKKKEAEKIKYVLSVSGYKAYVDKMMN